MEININAIVALILAAGPTISALTEVLKRLPKVPVNSDNATVVVLVLATIAILGPAWLGGGLTTQNAAILAESIVVTFGVGLGAYGFAKTVVAKFNAKFRR
jgi:hypothetical protein